MITEYRLRRALAEARRELAEARRQADTDPLTGLANRRAMQRTLDDWIRRGAPFAVIVFDVANLHAKNKADGHQAGDDVLRAVADLIRAETDHVAARQGGDEFAVLLPDCSLRDTERVRERIERAFGVVPVNDRASVFLAGAATTWRPGDDLVARLTAADHETNRRKVVRKRERGEATTRAEAIA